MSEQNPANDVKVSEIPEGYIPMSAPVQRLQVPEMPGFKLHWFRGEPGRIARAQRAGYKFVEPDEVRVNNFDLGGSKDNSGNTDLGTRVSIEAGEDDGRLYLMKIPQELYDYAQKLLGREVDSVVDALTSGKVGSENDEEASDTANRYVQRKRTKLFKKRP
jgi:hypothetical protein